MLNATQVHHLAMQSHRCSNEVLRAEIEKVRRDRLE
jgi:hypothetical protein